VNGQTLNDEDVRFPGLLLIPQSVDTKLMRVSGRARRMPARYGVPFDDIAYLIPIAGGGEDSPVVKVFRELDQLREEYQRVAEETYPDYEAHKQKIINNPQYESLQQYLLDRDQWTRAHTLRCGVFPLSGLPTDYGAQVAAKIREEYESPEIRQAADGLGRLAETVAESSSMMSFSTSLEGNASWAQSVHKAAADMAARAATELVQAPMQEMIDTLKNFEDILLKGKTVRDSSVQRVRDAYAKLRNFDFMLPQSSRDILSRLGSRLDQTYVSDISGSMNAGAARALAGYISDIRTEFVEREKAGDSLNEICCMIEMD
jgi:hypothetical protein